MEKLENIICVDIDGVLADCSNNNVPYELRRPLPGAAESLAELRSMGYYVFLHTGRHILESINTIKWLKKHGMVYDHIEFGKPPARIYIDDRGVHFKNWEETMNKVRSMS